MNPTTSLMLQCLAGLLLLAPAADAARAGRAGGILGVARVADTLKADSTFLRGALRPVPCNDGSMIGGILDCPYVPWFQGCDELFMMRSLDGGRTWDAESMPFDRITSAEIVRIRGGDLLALGSVVMRSSDNGRTWTILYDRQRPADPTWLAFGLKRDYRGLLFWNGGGLNVSLDNGRTRVWLRGADNRDYGWAYHVLPPHGHILSPNVEGWRQSGYVNLSTDHGRSWRHTIEGRGSRGDTNDVYSGFDVINDTMVVGHSYNDRPWPDGRGLLRNLYYNSGSQTWTTGRYVYPLQREGVLDSTRWYYGYGLMADLSGPVDTIPPREPVSTPPMIDRYGRRSDSKDISGLSGQFYDLDGNVHMQCSGFWVPARAPRPVSRLDKIYTCTGVEYVVGGRVLERVVLDDTLSSNARLEYVITPNRRMATINVTSIDSTRPMRCRLIVDDSTLGRQWFTDSVSPPSSMPSLWVAMQRKNVTLRCLYPEGPYMWFRNGQPLPLPEGFDGDVVGDSMLVNPAAGTYQVMARSPQGCDVWSNQIDILPTSVSDPTGASEASAPAPVSFVSADGTIELTWSLPAPISPSIIAYDILGRRLPAEVDHSRNRTRIEINNPTGLVLLVITTGTHQQVLQIMR
ncbi:MAG: exo-alpha-sialidase [Candidatus Kapabacteria bacterium]|nr:exo-alpha-sialidase [Candidatus Kapabacteria bacterium]